MQQIATVMVAQGNIAAATKIKPLYLLSGINLTPIKYTDTLAYASSAVFAAHDCAQHSQTSYTLQWARSPQNCPYLRGKCPCPNLIHGSIHTPNCTLISSAILQDSPTCPTDRHTDRPTTEHR